MPYFDHNATHPVSAAARNAWLDALEKYPANPSSPHRLGSRASAALEAAREQLAGWLGGSTEDYVFTSGATESNNAILAHLAAALDPADTVWISSMEHPCVLAAARRHLEGRHQLIPATPDGVVDAGWIQERLRGQHPRPAVIAVMAANNETGILQPWQQVRDLCHESGIQFFCDAAQWVGKMPATGLGECDFVSGCAHKFGGPPGVGFLKAGPGFGASIVGGSQENGRRAGTENTPGILAMVAALAEREASLGSIPERMKLRGQFIERLIQQVPGTVIPGRSSAALWNTVAAQLPAFADCRQRWVVKLDRLGFSVSSGSACSSGKEQPSHVMAAMGYSGEASDRTVRFSSGWDTTPQDWDALLEAVRQTASNR